MPVRAAAASPSFANSRLTASTRSWRSGTASQSALKPQKSRPSSLKSARPGPWFW